MAMPAITPGCSPPDLPPPPLSGACVGGEVASNAAPVPVVVPVVSVAVAVRVLVAVVVPVVVPGVVPGAVVPGGVVVGLAVLVADVGTTKTDAALDESARRAGSSLSLGQPTLSHGLALQQPMKGGEAPEQVHHVFAPVAAEHCCAGISL